MDHFQPVLPVADVPLGSCRKATVNHVDVVLFHVDEGIFALNAACPHARGPLAQGSLDGVIVTCPWHNWTFDVRTGVSPGGAKAITYPVSVRDGRIWVDAGPPPDRPPPPPIVLPEDM
jgi:nitrite reductase/ring-hydroxylating ferredoxin subunit